MCISRRRYTCAISPFVRFCKSRNSSTWLQMIRLKCFVVIMKLIFKVKWHRAWKEISCHEKQCFCPFPQRSWCMRHCNFFFASNCRAMRQNLVIAAMNSSRKCCCSVVNYGGFSTLIVGSLAISEIFSARYKYVRMASKRERQRVVLSCFRY